MLGGAFLALTQICSVGMGKTDRIMLSRSLGDIAYAVAGSHYGSEIHLDQLRVGAIARTSTDAAGAFRLDELQAGTYQVRVAIPVAWQVTEPASATRQVTLAGGQLPGQLSFGAAPPRSSISAICIQQPLGPWVSVVIHL